MSIFRNLISFLIPKEIAEFFSIGFSFFESVFLISDYARKTVIAGGPNNGNCNERQETD